MHSVKIKCIHCQNVFTRCEIHHHIRQKHGPSFARDPQALYARNSGAHQPVASRVSPCRISSTPPPSNVGAPGSSNTFSTESDLTPSMAPSTRFSVWQETNSVLPSLPTTIDDIALSHNQRTDLPQTSAQHLRNSVRFQIQDLVYRFESLDTAARQTCIEGVRCMPIFPMLYAHVFTHLKLCAPDKPNLLVDLENMRSDWASRDSAWCLMHFKTIKDDLSALLNRANVESHVCNEALSSRSRLHALDIQDIGALIASSSVYPEGPFTLFRLKDDEAQLMLDLLQTLLVMKSDQLEGWYKRRFLDAIIRLSRKSGHFPRSLQLQYIDNLEPTSFHGSFGAIFKGELLGRVVAIKEVQTAGRTVEQFLKDFSNEVVVWCHTQHENCLPFYGIFHLNDHGASRTCLVSPWMENGHLNSYLQRHPRVDRAPLVLDIAQGLVHLHGIQPTIVHGDLKGANILITPSGRACLADFGFATTQDPQVQAQNTMGYVAGTTSFMAPELLEARTNPSLLVDKRPSDIFALGCICYEMYNGARPFWQLNSSAVDEHFISGKRPSRPMDEICIQRGLDDDMWDFIQNLWHQDPKVRATASQASLWMSHKMHMAGKSTDRPPAEMEWDLEFLTECTTGLSDFNPFSLE